MASALCFTGQGKKMFKRIRKFFKKDDGKRVSFAHRHRGPPSLPSSPRGGMFELNVNMSMVTSADLLLLLFILLKLIYVFQI